MSSVIKVSLPTFLLDQETPRVISTLISKEIQHRINLNGKIKDRKLKFSMLEASVKNGEIPKSLNLNHVLNLSPKLDEFLGEEAQEMQTSFRTNISNYQKKQADLLVKAAEKEALRLSKLLENRNDAFLEELIHLTRPYFVELRAETDPTIEELEKTLLNKSSLGKRKANNDTPPVPSLAAWSPKLQQMVNYIWKVLPLIEAEVESSIMAKKLSAIERKIVSDQKKKHVVEAQEAELEMPTALKVKELVHQVVSPQLTHIHRTLEALVKKTKDQKAAAPIAKNVSGTFKRRAGGASATSKPTPKTKNTTTQRKNSVEANVKNANGDGKRNQNVKTSERKGRSKSIKPPNNSNTATSRNQNSRQNSSKRARKKQL